MAKNAVINIRTEAETKKQIEKLFSQFGITVSDAVNMFFHQSLMQNGLPFTPQIPTPNAETILAIKEVEEMKKNPEQYKGYTNVDDMMKDLLIWNIL